MADNTVQSGTDVLFWVTAKLHTRPTNWYKNTEQRGHTENMIKRYGDSSYNS